MVFHSYNHITLHTDQLEHSSMLLSKLVTRQPSCFKQLASTVTLVHTTALVLAKDGSMQGREPAQAYQPLRQEIQNIRNAPNKAEYMYTRVDDIVNYMKTNSIWPMTFGRACCAVEMMYFAAPRFVCLFVAVV